MSKILTKKGWEKVGMHHHHGMQVPLLSIRTKNSCGNGEFLDLLPLIDWLASLGMDVLQLLPLNDSGPDASPYNALSSTALHPIYLSLHALPHSENLEAFKPYNETKRVSYPELLEKKESFLTTYVKQHGEEITKKTAYQTFIKRRPDLEEYAKYKGNDPFSHLIIQFLCHQQLKQVKTHAESKGVFLEGDLPILVSPESVDVQANQKLFNLSYQAGSPPNPFDPLGQNWEFPLYHWDAMEENGFAWWRTRLQVFSEYFHLYRIDHILGFFRIWAIPHGKTPDQGRFKPQDPHTMEKQGRTVLQALLSFSDLLPIGEDLGDPPPFVKETMKEYGIPGTKIFRRYRNWKTDGSFIPYKDYAPISLTSVSTHDLEPVALWWKNFPDEAKAYAAFKGWNYEEDLSIDHHREILIDNHHSGSLFHVNLLQEYLALTPDLTWETPEEERINIPGTESTRNWTYRYKCSLETLIESKPLRAAITQIVQLN